VTTTTNISTRGQWTGQPLQKKQRTTNTTDSNATRNSNGNSSGTTAKTLPDLRNHSHKDLLTEKVKDYFTNVYLPARKLAKIAPTEEVEQKEDAIVKQHNQVIIHYQEEIRSKTFAGIQNGKNQDYGSLKGISGMLPM
jgi:hypothetical protein